MPCWAFSLMAACSLLAGASTWLTARFAPEASGSGIPHVKEVLLGLRQMRWIRIILVKFIGGFLGLAAGLSLGREGPTIQIGAATGRGVAEKARRAQALVQDAHLLRRRRRAVRRRSTPPSRVSFS